MPVDVHESDSNQPTLHTFLPSENTIVAADVHHTTVFDVFNIRYVIKLVYLIIGVMEIRKRFVNDHLVNGARCKVGTIVVQSGKKGSVIQTGLIGDLTQLKPLQYRVFSSFRSDLPTERVE